MAWKQFIKYSYLPQRNSIGPKGKQFWDVNLASMFLSLTECDAVDLKRLKRNAASN